MLFRSNLDALMDYCWRVRQAVNAQGFPAVDHVELSAPSPSVAANARNFVLCPGRAYDRSPCGTGTSAKLACLAASGKLQPGEQWVQESIIGSRFTGSYRLDAEGHIIPRVVGRAFICGESVLIQQPADPFRHGIVGEVSA